MNTRRFTNEGFDLAQVAAAEMGFDVPGMAVPVSEERSDETLFAQVTNNAFAGRPLLVRAGARIWLMGYSLGLKMPKLDRAGMTLMRSHLRVDAADCLLMAGGVEMGQRIAVFEMLVGGETTLWRMGRRASLLAYALNRGVIIREALESFAVIGELWELRAENKRSAVSAAMNELRAELVKHGRLPPGFRFWFEKEAGARAVYSMVQRGNCNRAGAGQSDDETMRQGDCECHGVPVRREWARLSGAERKRRLDALWERHAWVPGSGDHETMGQGDFETLSEGRAA
jgi:hypothetical protein